MAWTTWKAPARPIYDKLVEDHINGLWEKEIERMREEKEKEYQYCKTFVWFYELTKGKK